MKIEVFNKKKKMTIYLLTQLMYALLILAVGYLMAVGWTAMMSYLRGFL